MFHDHAENAWLEMLPFAGAFGDGNEIAAQEDLRNAVHREQCRRERRILRLSRRSEFRQSRSCDLTAGEKLESGGVGSWFSLDEHGNLLRPCVATSTDKPEDILDGRHVASSDRSCPIGAIAENAVYVGVIRLKTLHFRAGCPSFWLVNLEMLAVTAYALDGDTYCQIAHVTGEQPWAAVLPFAVTIVPARLLD